MCISGGGIRSATFGLGLIQSLARHDLLDKFHYLSTVSAAGMWAAGLLRGFKPPEGLDGVIDQLKPDPAPETKKGPANPEAKPIQHLRSYSNYMSPRLGLLSADSWTLAATVVRNLLLNWMVLIPILAAILMVPRVCVPVVRWPAFAEYPWLRLTTLAVGSLCVVWSIVYVGFHRPSASRDEPSSRPSDGGWGPQQTQFLISCLLPLMAAAIILTTHWQWIRLRIGPTPTQFLYLEWGFTLYRGSSMQPDSISSSGGRKHSRCWFADL